MASPWLPAPGVTLHWAPESYISPCFMHFRDDVAVRALTGSQVALHEQRLAYKKLLHQSEADKDDWERRKREMEDLLNAMAVRNAEAERLFKRQEQQLATRLADTQQALDELVGEHQELQQASAEELKQLQDKIAQLQQACKDLEGERAQLQHKLKDAEVTAQARREAEQRVAQLESAIAATQARARELVNSITKQRDEAEAAGQQLRARLTDTQQALADQHRRRGEAEEAAKHLLLFNNQLSRSLNMERLINEPLRHTNHASTTLAHVMRSVAAPMVDNRSRMSFLGPAEPLPAAPTPLQAVYVAANPASPHHTSSPRPHTAGPQPAYMREDGSGGVPVGQVSPPSSPGVTSTPPADLAGQLAADSNPASREVASAPAPLSPGWVDSAGEPVTPRGTPPTLQPYSSPLHGDHSTIRSVGRTALTLLGRSWATTTTTAGEPHPVYVDNLQRFTPVYASPQGTTAGTRVTPHRPHSAGRGPRVAAVRPRSAGPAARARAPQQVLSPAALDTLLLFQPGASAFNVRAQAAEQAGARSNAAQGRLSPGYRRPTTAMLHTYHQTRPRTPLASPAPSPTQGTVAAAATYSPTTHKKTPAVAARGRNSPARPRSAMRRPVVAGALAMYRPNLGLPYRHGDSGGSSSSTSATVSYTSASSHTTMDYEAAGSAPPFSTFLK